MGEESKMAIVRREKPEDVAEIRRVNEQAFGQAAEADLVDALRAGGQATLSLVAVEDGRVVGHIFFSPVAIESAGKTFPALGLAPMAVLPEWQRRGIGSLLVETGLAECRKAGCECVVVLGHPEYYPRFGFRPASRYGIQSEYDVPDEVFMLIELRADALQGRAGLAKYQPEFRGTEKKRE
jgi:putative acetyltransferase